MFNMGKPVLSDAEFDALKATLLEQGSPIAVKVRMHDHPPRNTSERRHRGVTSRGG